MCPQSVIRGDTFHEANPILLAEEEEQLPELVAEEQKSAE